MDQMTRIELHSLVTCAATALRIKMKYFDTTKERHENATFLNLQLSKRCVWNIYKHFYDEMIYPI